MLARKFVLFIELQYLFKVQTRTQAQEDTGPSSTRIAPDLQRLGSCPGNSYSARKDSEQASKKRTDVAQMYPKVTEGEQRSMLSRRSPNHIISLPVTSLNHPTERYNVKTTELTANAPSTPLFSTHATANL